MTLNAKRASIISIFCLAAAVAGIAGFGQDHYQNPKKKKMYLPPIGVTFAVSPQEAKDAGGRWARIDRLEADVPETHNFGEAGFTTDHVALTYSHRYRVTFRQIPNWETPSPIDFEIDRDNGVTVSAQYRIMSGTLRVTIQPAELANAGARWAVNSMDAPWHRSGESSSVAVGTYTLLFDRFDATQWNPPSQTTLRINPQTPTNFIATFTRK